MSARVQRRWRLAAVLVGLGAAVLRPATAHAQPSPPVGPQSRAVCEGHRRAWDAFIQSLVAAHDGCLEANKKNKATPWVEGAACSEPACESLHQQRDQARRDANAAVSLCYREVAAYEKKKRDEELAEKKRQEEIERNKRALEEELKRKQEEMARLQREEEARRKREEADALRDEQAAQDQQQRDDAAEQQRARDEEARQQAVRDEEERVRRAEADRVAQEEEARRDQERKDERDRAFDRALEQTKREFEAFERRTRQRAQAMEQTAQQAASLAQQAGERLASQSAAIAKTIDELRKAVSDWSGTASGSPQKSVQDLMGQFDMEQVASGGETEQEPLAKEIHRLIDRTQTAMPHRAVEMEYVRSIFDEAYGGVDRLQPVFDQIASMEGADPRAADEFVDGYSMRVFGPANTTRILTEVYGADTPLAQVASTRDRIRQVAAAYEARDPRALLRASYDWMAGDEGMLAWWAEDATTEPQIARDRRGMPIIVGPDGKPVGYDDEADRVSYGFDDIPALLQERGARLLRRGDATWARSGVLFAPYARPMETPKAAAQDMRGWLAGEMVGVALQGGRP